MGKQTIWEKNILKRNLKRTEFNSCCMKLCPKSRFVVVVVIFIDQTQFNFPEDEDKPF